jgi:tRNA(Ile)-lysidine synthase
MTSGTAARARPALFHRMVRTIRERHLLQKGQHVLVAVSGGPDSIAMLSLLAMLASAWRLRLTAVHFNYALRRTESDDDEAFVTIFCRERGIPLIVQRPVLTKRRRASSLQARARDARYRAMASLADDLHADRIATGHTANDQAETMLLWMMRGAGLTGLSGMPFIREQRIIRPLLRTTRDEVLDYLKREGLPFRRDSSNSLGLYRRNRVRHELLPVIERITPAIVRLLERQSELLRADEDYLESVVSELYRALVIVDSDGEQRIERAALMRLPVALQRRVVRWMLRTSDPDGRAPRLHAVEQVLRLASANSKGTQVSIRSAQVFRDHDGVVVSRAFRRKRVQASSSSSLPVVHVPTTMPATIYWPGTGQEIHVQVMPKRAAEPWLKQRTRECAVFDGDRLTTPLIVRPWQAGDRIHPRGMGGKRKKLQDLFTDMKISRQQRSRIPLLVAPQGILWVVGRREDERFLPGKDTSRCLVATVESKTRNEGAG